MNKYNRELLIIVKDFYGNEFFIEQEINQLNKILGMVDSLDHFCTVNEIVDLRKYAMVKETRRITKIVQQKVNPFIFIIGKN